ncbi:42438_t:CDS:2, partial [Gigaspora margarita]
AYFMDVLKGRLRCEPVSSSNNNVLLLSNNCGLVSSPNNCVTLHYDKGSYIVLSSNNYNNYSHGCEPVSSSNNNVLLLSSGFVSSPNNCDLVSSPQNPVSLHNNNGSYTVLFSNNYGCIREKKNKGFIVDAYEKEKKIEAYLTDVVLKGRLRRLCTGKGRIINSELVSSFNNNGLLLSNNCGLVSSFNNCGSVSSQSGIFIQ